MSANATGVLATFPTSAKRVAADSEPKFEIVAIAGRALLRLATFFATYAP